MMDNKASGSIQLVWSELRDESLVVGLNLLVATLHLIAGGEFGAARSEKLGRETAGLSIDE